MESSFDMLKKMIRDMDLAHKKLGVELAYLNVPYFRQLQETFPEAEFVDISSMFVLARSVRMRYRCSAPCAGLRMKAFTR